MNTWVRLILSDGRWHKGADLARSGRTTTRALRAYAESTGRLISTQDGYKLTTKATPAELEAAENSLLSRIRKLESRIVRTRRIFKNI